MRIGLAMAFGWLCGAVASHWLNFPAGLLFALLAGAAYGAADTLVFSKLERGA